MKVTITRCQAEGSRGIVFESKTAPALRFAAERRGLHTSKEDNWLFERLQNELQKLGTDCTPRGSFTVKQDHISKKIVR